MRVVDRKTLEAFQMRNEVVRERAVIHVRAGGHAGRGHNVAGRPAVPQDERRHVHD